MYSFREEGLSGKVGDIFPYLILMCDNDTSVASAERVMLRKGLKSTVTFILKVKGG